MSDRPPGEPRVEPRQRWWLVTGVVVVVLLGAIVDRSVARPPPPPAPSAVASAAAPSGSESSSWYCAGGSGSAGPVPVTVLLTNASDHSVHGTVTAFSDRGHSAAKAVDIPARGQVAAVPSQMVQGSWLAARVELEGGGVVVSQEVGSPSAWSASPCASTVSSAWYFASGSTAAGSRLLLSLFNPTGTPAVVDSTFVTTAGPTQPAPFEGVVVPPHSVVVAEVGTFVQDQAAVATSVVAHSGKIAAAEVQLEEGSVHGVSVRVGAPQPQRRWSVPRMVDPAGGTAALDVFNPSTAPARVRVDVRLPTGPLAPFEQTVAPGGTWHLDTSASKRVPDQVDFSATVVAQGRGPGVVVDRTVVAPPTAASPQWGSASAVPAGDPGHRAWVVPAASGALSGARPDGLAVANLGGHSASVTVDALAGPGATGVTRLARIQVGAGGFAVFTADLVNRAGGRPLLVEASQPIAVAEDEQPAGATGVVSVAAVPTG